MKKSAFFVISLLGLTLLSLQPGLNEFHRPPNIWTGRPDPFLNHCGKLEIREYLRLSELAGRSGAVATRSSMPGRSRIEDGPGVWESLGPDGGMIQGMAVRSSNPAELYAVTNTWPSLVYKTTNGGLSWSQVASLSASSRGIALDPTDANKIYVVHYNGFVKSSNGGSSWDNYDLGGNCYSSYSSSCFYQDPASPSTMFIAGEYCYDPGLGKTCMAVFKSTNGGEIWTPKTIFPTSDSGMAYCLAVDPADANILYAGGYELKGSSYLGKVYKSINGGDTWTDVTGSISYLVNCLLIDPGNSQRVFAGTNNKIYRSSNGGQSWLANIGYAAHDLAIDLSNANVLYAGYASVIFKSTDGGVNWSYHSSVHGTCYSLLAATSSTLYCGSTAGVYKSTNGGVSWQESHSGIVATSIPALAVAPSNAGSLYEEVRYNGFFKSSNYGTSWTRLPDFYRCDSITRIIVSPNDSRNIFILAGG